MTEGCTAQHSTAQVGDYTVRAGQSKQLGTDSQRLKLLLLVGQWLVSYAQSGGWDRWAGCRRRVDGAEYLAVHPGEQKLSAKTLHGARAALDCEESQLLFPLISFACK